MQRLYRQCIRHTVEIPVQRLLINPVCSRGSEQRQTGSKLEVVRVTKYFTCGPSLHRHDRLETFNQARAQQRVLAVGSGFFN